MEEKRKELTWYERVFDTLDFPELPTGAGIEIEAEPTWLVNVLRELVQQSMPTVQIRKPKLITPLEVGRCLGQMRANADAIRLAVSRLQNDWVTESFVANQHVPAVQMALDAVRFLDRALVSLDAIRERFDQTVKDAWKTALEQSSGAESAEFFRGFSEGISKPGLTVDARLAGATTATPIYLRLFSERRHIEKLNSVRELRDFLLERGLSEQVLGDPKRLEKLCERIELTFSGPGRKKRAN